MTVIVASLFLPYTVEFQIDQEVDENLIKDLTVEKKPPAELQQPQAQPVVTTQASSASILTRSRISTQNQNEFRTANSSVEDFFNQGSSVVSPSKLGELYSTQNNSSNSFQDELSSRLLKLNRSTSSAFVPKSTVNASLLKKSVNQSDVNLAKLNKTLKKQHQSSLKHVVSAPADDGADEDEGVYSSISSAIGSEDEDEEFYSTYNQQVPKFGGFSKKNVLKNTSNNEETNELIFKDFDIVPFSKGNGALRTAVNVSLDGHRWLGTVGIPTDRLPERTKTLISEKLTKEYKCDPVFSSDSTFQAHYKNFCKEILWPTLHYQIPDNPNSKAFEDHSWEFYKKLNQEFADKIFETYKEGDIIWIHDYHLFLLPKMVRELLPNAKIGFFLHVSFPSSEIFKCFPQRECLLEGMLGANYIGFQTEEYCRHFGQTCNKLLLADISNNEVRYKGSISHISSSPVGIDAQALMEQFHTSAAIKSWRKMIRERWTENTKLIVCRDKVDRIRGVKQKLLSYEMFLRNNPEYIEKTTLIQICLKSSGNADSNLESEIMLIVDRINALAPNISSSSQPVVFLHQDVEFVQYLALLAEADCFIVSSMREGMNLTCHEFIVASESKKAPLILSEFTGSASVFSDDDVFKINPWDLRQFSNSIKSAMELPEDIKEKHWNNTINVVKNQDCSNWVKLNLEKIQESWKLDLDKKAFNYRAFNFGQFYETYKNSSTSGKKVFILNLSNIIPNDRILKILNDLASISNNEIYIFSNFKKNEMERYFRVLLPKIGFIAENGGLVKLANVDQTWISLIDSESFKRWVKDSKKLFTSFEERLAGSFFEVGKTFIKFHTESCRKRSLIDPERTSLLIGDLISHINDFERDDNEINLGRSDSVASTSTTASGNQASNSVNAVDFGDLKIHATLSEDEIIYIEQINISLKIINFLIDYYSNDMIKKLVDDKLKSNNKVSEVIDIGSYPSTFMPPSPPVTSATAPTLRVPQFGGLKSNENSEEAKNIIKMLTIAGKRNIFFDGIFDYINEKADELKAELKVKSVFSIGYENGVESRGAKEYVEGLNDLFSILKQLT